MKVLATRVVMFEHFLELAVQMDGHLQEQHKHAWLMFRICDILDPDMHPVIEIIVAGLVGAETYTPREIVRRVSALRNKYFHHDPRFFFVLDEAQVSAGSFPCAFMSSRNNSKPQSIFCEIINVWANLNFAMVNFIVSGTGLFLDAVNEVLSSGVGKQAAKKFDVFHDVGSFNTEKSQRAYWDQYVPQAFLTSS
jgi:hypothetical protein